MTRQTVTREQAEQAIAAIRATFPAYVEPAHFPADGDLPAFTIPAMSDGPRLIEGWDGRDEPIIAWEDGAPYDWTYTATGGGIDEEEAALLAEVGGTPKPYQPVTDHPDWPAGVWAEPVNNVMLALYPVDGAR